MGPALKALTIWHSKWALLFYTSYPHISSPILNRTNSMFWRRHPTSESISAGDRTATDGRGKARRAHRSSNLLCCPASGTQVRKAEVLEKVGWYWKARGKAGTHLQQSEKSKWDSQYLKTCQKGAGIIILDEFWTAGFHTRQTYK